MNSKAPWWQRFSLLLIAVAGSASYIAQINHDTWRRFGPPKIQASYNELIEPQPLSPTIARGVSFGATEFVADLYWLQFIQYYGGGDPYGKYRKLAELFDTVTELSPKFSVAYTTGLVILPGEGFVDEAIKLGEKGQRNLPQSWEMPYYTGLVHHIYKKDYAKAGELFSKAAELPGAPENARYLAAVYFNRADQRQVAYQIFKTIYESSPEGFIKDRAKKYVEHLAGLFYLQDGVKAFETKFHRRPNDLNELVSRQIIPQLPISPLNLAYRYDLATGTITDNTK